MNFKLLRHSILADGHIQKVEEEKQAKYVLDTALPVAPNGEYTPFPIAVFYRETLNDEELAKGYSHYFGLFYKPDMRNTKHLYICDAQSVEQVKFTGIHDEQGNTVFSQYHHDFAELGDDFIDGGEHSGYLRFSGNLVNFYVRNGNIIWETPQNANHTRQ